MLEMLTGAAIAIVSFLFGAFVSIGSRGIEHKRQENDKS